MLEKLTIKEVSQIQPNFNISRTKNWNYAYCIQVYHF